jgi:hypothetical protein
MKPVLVVSMATMVMATVLATEIASKQSIDEAAPRYACQFKH